MRLFITSCLVALFSISAQANTERVFTIEADIIHEGEIKSLWSALNVRVISNGYSDCQMLYAGTKFDCSVSAINPESYADSNAVITMNEFDFAYLAITSAKNRSLPAHLSSQFYENISDYSRTYDTFTDKPAIKFLFYGDQRTQENTFRSFDGKTTSIIRVTRH